MDQRELKVTMAVCIPPYDSLLDLVEDGCTGREIAEQYGVCTRTVIRWCQTYRIKRQRGGHNRNSMIRAVLLDLVATGINRPKDLQKHLGIRTREMLCRMFNDLAKSGLIYRTGKTHNVHYHVTKRWTDKDGESL